MLTVGASYRVTKPASLVGWKPERGGSLSGFRVALSLGDVVTFVGRKGGWGSDPGPEEVLFKAASGGAGTLRPTAPGGWTTEPEPGLLEEVKA